MKKQVLLVRNDLGMRKGKACAQAAHASVMVVLDTIFNQPYEALKEWVETGQTKICLKVNSEEELRSYFLRAQENKLPCSLVIDEGRTEFNGVPTPTAVAIGPADAEVIDEITGNLELL